MKIRSSSVITAVVLALGISTVPGCVTNPDSGVPGGQTPGLGGKADSGAEDRGARVLTAIEAFNAELSEADRRAKYCRMAASAFSFYRGTNHLYWMDLAGDPRIGVFGNERTRIWLQGDMHAYNVGAFDDDRGRLVYELNDFDESVIADYQYDLWRLAISVILIAQENGGFSSASIEEILDTLSESYLDTVASFRGNDRELDSTVTAASAYGRLDEFLDDVQESESRRKMLDKESPQTANGIRRFDLGRSKLESVDDAEREPLRAAISAYAGETAGGLRELPGYFRVVDVARRVRSGTGSMGTPRYWVLVEGRTDSPDDDRILDVKRQGAPAAMPYLSNQEVDTMSGVAASDAARVVLAQRAMVVHADDHLGTLSLELSGVLSGRGGHYSVRERSPFKASFPTSELTSTTRLGKLAEQWAAILAAAHARSDKDAAGSGIEESFDKRVDLATDGEHKGFRRLVRSVATGYATQVNADFASFVDFVGETGCL